MKKMSIRAFPVLIVIAALLVTLCSQLSGPSATAGDSNLSTGIASVKMVTAQNSPFSRIADSAVFTVTADDIVTLTGTLTVTDSSVEGLITRIPAGEGRFITIDVYDDENILQYSGSDSVDVVADKVVSVSIDLIRVLGDVTIDGSVSERNPLDPILVAWWSFDSTYGNTYYDVTGHGFDATSSALTLTEGVKGRALSCPGTDYELVVNNSRDNFNLSKYSIETWFYSKASISNYIKIFDYQKIESGIWNGYGMHIDGAGRAVASIADLDRAWITATGTTVLQPEKWYHITGTYDGKELKIYVNGQLEGTTSFRGSYQLPDADARIACQTRTDGSVLYRLNGRLDEMKIYKYALSAETVKEHYEELNPSK